MPLKRLEQSLSKIVPNQPESLNDWPAFRGGPSRSDRGKGGTPFLEPTWTHSTLPIRADIKNWTEDTLKQATNVLENRNQPLLPAFFPVAVKDKLIYRNYDGAGGQFGDISVNSTSTDQSQLSVYGGIR